MTVVVTLKTGEQIVHSHHSPLTSDGILTVQASGPYSRGEPIYHYPLSSVERWVTQ